jgi:hypothetical protein
MKAPASTAWVFAAVAVAASMPVHAQRRPERMMADELFEAYRAAGPEALPKAGAMSPRFERFRDDFETRVLPAWKAGPRQPLQAMFMLEVAMLTEGRRHGFPRWEDFLTLGSAFLAGRPEPPGTNPAADAFEILWHQTAVAFLDGLQDPVLTDRIGVQPMKDRMAAVPARAGETQVLVEPWVELARGLTLERIALDHPEGFDVLGPQALTHYQQAVAAGSGATRAEATLRGASVLIDLRRPAEALTMLTGFETAWTTDETYRYWQPLLRGRALEALNRPDEAVPSYQDALRIVPSAEAPRVAIMALETKRRHTAEAAAQRSAIEHARTSTVDPWRSYRDGEARFLQARLDALRAMSRQ